MQYLHILGQLVPNDVVLDLLKEAMEARAADANGFLIDGYPREKSQGIEFEKAISPVTVSILHFSQEDRAVKKQEETLKV